MPVCVTLCMCIYRKVWKSLGDMNKEQSRQELIKLLDAATPQLKDYVLHQWRDEQRCGVCRVSVYVGVMKMSIGILVCTS